MDLNELYLKQELELARDEAKFLREKINTESQSVSELQQHCVKTETVYDKELLKLKWCF
jgi:hypothetical protein